jgi:hypothetical protein
MSAVPLLLQTTAVRSPTFSNAVLDVDSVHNEAQTDREGQSKERAAKREKEKTRQTTLSKVEMDYGSVVAVQERSLPPTMHRESCRAHQSSASAAGVAIVFENVP